MAKLQRGAKSQAIREQLEANPQATPKEVVAALKSQRIKVSSQMVSTLKAKMKGGAKKGRRKKAAGNGKFDIDTLIRAKKLAELLGGVEKAKVAIDALAKLQ